MSTTTASTTRTTAPAAARPRPASCPFCREKVDEVDYKHPGLRRFVTPTGRLRARHATGACRQHQLQLAVAVKRAREMALLPHVTS